MEAHDRWCAGTLERPRTNYRFQQVSQYGAALLLLLAGETDLIAPNLLAAGWRRDEIKSLGYYLVRMAHTRVVRNLNRRSLETGHP